MPKRRIVLLAAGVFVLLVTGCTTKTQPQMDSTPKEEASVPDTAKGEPLSPAGKQRVTLYVEGMTKVQGIT
jgi:hypothetical protein